MIISPYDEFALEEALLLQGGRGKAARSSCLAAGDDAVQASLRQALAMGADRAVHVQDPRSTRADALARARALAAAVRAEEPELVFTGKTASGTTRGRWDRCSASCSTCPHVGAVFAARARRRDGSPRTARSRARSRSSRGRFPP